MPTLLMNLDCSVQQSGPHTRPNYASIRPNRKKLLWPFYREGQVRQGDLSSNHVESVADHRSGGGLDSLCLGTPEILRVV